jgi:ABC-type iron transport system FetAB ATPase subunit
MLTVENLVLHGGLTLNFELAAGECLVVTGPSGSGKTLLLRALADLDPVSGNIFLNGHERQDFGGPEWRSRVRYFAAEPGWWEETPRPHFSAAKDDRPALEELGLTEPLLDRPIRELSTGERQRLAILRGLADDPDILLFDEPTSALDADARGRVELLISRALQHDKCVILVSHDEAQAKRLATRRLVLQGKKARFEEL